MSRRAEVEKLPIDETAQPPRWLPWLLVVAVVLTFGRIVLHPFVPADDYTTIALNKRLNPPSFTAESIGWYWANPGEGLYAPVTYTAWGLLARASYVDSPDEDRVHVDPAFFHAASLIVHAISALLAFALLRRLLAAGPGKAAAPPVVPYAAAGGALLFALHPLQAEPVAWASGLKDLLAGMFGLAALVLYFRATADRAGEAPPEPRPNPARKRTARTEPRPPGRSFSLPHYLAATACFALALLSKPSAVTVPVLAAIIDWLWFRRPARAVALRLAPWVLLAIPIAILAKLVQSGGDIPHTPFLERPVVAGASLAFYLGELVWPTELAFDHGWRPPVVLRQTWFWLIALVPLVVAVVLVIFRRRPTARALATAGLLMAAALGPVLGLAPFSYQFFSTVADHYMYLAMVGPALAAAWLLSRPALAKRATVALAAAVLLGLAVLTVVQLGHWRDHETFCRRIIAVTPDSAFGHEMLGKYFVRKGRLPEAEASLRRAVQINPDFVDAHRGLLRVYGDQGRVGDYVATVRAIRQTSAGRREAAERVAVRVGPDDALTVAGARALAAGRREEAIGYLTAALEDDPRDERAAALLGVARGEVPIKPR
ncbi:MAG TPA: tetratricopeptide repeat protein [Tepidisphaeraceae bacterium]|nr:tetratricopeptide repeat protein [Tepidisphaeraceae bacterium]